MGRANQTLEPIRTLPEYQWWKPEESDPAQFELTAPHWSPDFEFQESQQAANSAEPTDATDSWQFQEIPLDATALPREQIEGGEALLQSLSATKDKRILVLDSDSPAQEEFPEIFYD